MLPLDFFGKKKLSFKIYKPKDNVHESVSKFVSRQINSNSLRRTRLSFDDKARHIRSELGYNSHERQIQQKIILKRNNLSINLLNYKIKRERYQKSQNNSKQRSSQSSFEILKNQLEHIDRNSVFPQKLNKRHKNSTPTSRKIEQSTVNKSINKNAKQFVIEKQLNGYMEFIYGSLDKKYLVSCNFNAIRQKNKEAAMKMISINHAKLIETIFVFILRNLKDYNQKKTQLLIMEFCSIYLNSFEKAKIEVSIIYHIFQNFSNKIRPIFVYCRLIIYFIYFLSQRHLIFQQKFLKPLTEALEEVHLLYSKVIDVLQDKYRQTAFDMSKDDTNVVDTFKGLRIIKQVQKRVPTIQRSISSIQVSEYPELNEFKTQLKPFLMQNGYYYHLQEYLTRSEMIMNWNYFSIPPVPYLPSQNNFTNLKKPYTILLGLNGTLVYYNSQSKVIKYRPYLDRFLTFLKKHFHLVLFSCINKQQTDFIVSSIQDSKNIFQYRLYRNHMCYWNGKMIKNLLNVGRDLSKTIMIDDNLSHFQNCPNNGIVVQSYKGGNNDKQLLQALAIVLKMVQSETKDVRQFMRKQKKTLSHIQEELQQHTITINQY